jgi:glycosyltransferase involved in cell wall biosynthesis
MTHATAQQPRIEILLATYNGARFLGEQIDSVLTQQDIDVRILARDDGSRDDTPIILAKYAALHPERFRVLPTDMPTGSAQRNFHQLLLASQAQYVAFCDQDDVWLPNKLQRAFERMQQLESQHGTTTPLLVSTDLRVVDETLQTVALSLWQQNGLANATNPPLGQLLSDNTVTGCTALLNRTLVDCMREMPAAALMHDHWAALIAASTGALAGVEEATILYRQHNSNVVGAVASRSPLQKLQRLLSREAVEDRALQYRKDRAQAQALLQLHATSMNPTARSTVEAFIHLEEMPRIKRIRTMQQYSLWRSGTSRKLVAIADILRT